MNKEEIIKQIIGKVLFPKGFQFISNSDMDLWYFRRRIMNKKEEEIVQDISVEGGAYENKLILQLDTTAYGWFSRRMSSFVPDCKKNAKHYKDEEEFIDAVKEYADIIEKYALSYLEIMSEPTTEEYPKNKDYERFYRNYRQMADDFMKREGIEKTEDIDKAIEVIENTLIKNIDRKFEEIMDIILELAAFYTIQLEKKYKCSWEQSDINHSIYFLKIINQESSKIINPISKIFNCRKEEKKEIDRSLRADLLD